MNDNDASEAARVRAGTELLEAARVHLGNNDLKEAYQLLNRAKALKAPVQDVDHLRAIILRRVKQPLSAREVLLEELRYFPGNEEARQLLARIEAEFPGLLESTVPDEAFQAVYPKIRPYTMLSEQRLYSLFTLTRKVCDLDIPGNLVECGVAAGGASALMATVIQQHSRSPRTLFAFDTFEGMPEPSDQDVGRGLTAEESGWGTGTCAAPVESLVEVCEALGVADLVKPVKGYFENTLPGRVPEIGPVALLHLDSDWYDSTKVVLDNLYDNITDRGFIQLDDYHFWEGVGIAFHNFERERCLEVTLNEIDGVGVWFEKPGKKISI